MKYRKKPVEVEAFQFKKETFNRESCPDWLEKAMRKGVAVFWSQHGGDVIGGRIVTLEGEMEVSEFDYIIQGVHGELYPCKPDIFELTYEEVGNVNG